MKKSLTKKYIEIPIHLVLSIIVILFLGTLPQLFVGMKFDIKNYIDAITSTFSKLIGNTPITYSAYMKPLFPQILIQYKETTFIFLCHFLFL